MPCFGLGNDLTVNKQEKIEEIKLSFMMKLRHKKHAFSMSKQIH